MYTVQDLTNRTGLTEREIRYLIGMDLLPNLKVYTKEHLYQIHQFIILKAIGLPLPHLQNLLKIKNVTLWKKYLQNHLTFLHNQSVKINSSIYFVQLILNSIEIEGALVWKKIVKVFYGTLGNQIHFAHSLSLKDQQILVDFPEIYHSNTKTNLLVKILKNCKKQQFGSFSRDREHIISNDLVHFLQLQFPNEKRLALKVWNAQKLVGQIFPFYPMSKEVLDYLNGLMCSSIKMVKTS